MHGVLSTAMVDFVNAVPEPHTYALMLGGIAVIGAVVNLRRRLQRTQATYR
jgi:hypothetical protein